MASNPKSGGFTTVYEGEEAGTLAFKTRKDVDAVVSQKLDLVRQLKKDFEEETAVVAGLQEVEMQLHAMRISDEEVGEIQKKMAKIMEVPLPSGKTLKLDAFRKTAAKASLADNEEYRGHVKKLVRNTEGNITHLLLTWPDDTILQKFVGDLQKMEFGGDARLLRIEMEALAKSPQLWHYNEKKKDFLLEFLRPFQEHFGKPVDQLTEEELQASIQKVEDLRKTKLQEMTHLTLVEDRGGFRVHNRGMHPIMNGKSTDFWGSGAVRDEFIGLMNKLLTRFSLNLEDRFLLFKSKDEGFAYLVGFADEAFDQMVEFQDGKMGIYPHLKVFLKGSSGDYNEILQENYAGDHAAYYRALKTSVVPFLASMAVMLETMLSPQIREAFDMWI